jgi:citrate synthase
VPIGRLPGWIAQWKERHDAPRTNIQRPRQIYTGPPETNYVPPEKR